VNRAWPAQAAVRGALGLEANQVEDLAHEDQFTHGPEINGWHKHLRPCTAPRTEKRKP